VRVLRSVKVVIAAEALMVAGGTIDRLRDVGGDGVGGVVGGVG
jgi:hypothetical protein